NQSPVRRGLTDDRRTGPPRCPPRAPTAHQQSRRAPQPQRLPGTANLMRLHSVRGGLTEALPIPRLLPETLEIFRLERASLARHSGKPAGTAAAASRSGFVAAAGRSVYPPDPRLATPPRRATGGHRRHDARSARGGRPRDAAVPARPAPGCLSPLA